MNDKELEPKNYVIAPNGHKVDKSYTAPRENLSNMQPKSIVNSDNLTFDFKKHLPSVEFVNAKIEFDKINKEKNDIDRKFILVEKRLKETEIELSKYLKCD